MAEGSSALLFMQLLLLLGGYKIAASQTSSSLFQCQNYKGGVFYTPNLPDVYFNPSGYGSAMVSNLIGAAYGVTYIFTIPPEPTGCNGVVLAMQTCYQTNNDSLGNGQVDFLKVLILVKDNLQFNITKSVIIQANASSSTCTAAAIHNVEQTCCEVIQLSNDDQFRITSSNYIFGLVVMNNNLRPLHFVEADTDYDVDQYQVLNGTNPLHSIPISPDTRVMSDSLLLLRFLIALTSPITTTTTSATTSATAPATTSATTPATTSAKTSATINTTANTTTTAGAIADTTSSTVSANSSTGEPTRALPPLVSLAPPSPSPDRPISLGSVVGGTGAVIVVSLVLVVVVLVAFRYHRHKTLTAPSTEVGVAANATYEVVNPRLAQEYDDCKDSQNSFYDECEVESVIYHEPVSLPTENTSVEGEELYMAPAFNEEALYSQLEDIKIQNLLRDSVNLGDSLGAGQFGTVYRGQWSCDGRVMEVAVKTLKEGTGEEDRVKFLQEVAIMGQFRHPNVVTMHGVVTDGEPVLLVLELLPKGDLRGHLLRTRSEDGGTISMVDHTLLGYCRQVSCGMVYLSSKAFVHRDLAARNILVSDDNICKIADFGMSRDLMYESYYFSHGGMIPVKWTAPEALHYKKYSPASDVWSFGVVLYEVWSMGCKPFERLANDKVMNVIDTGYRLPPPPGCPRRLYSLMMACWHADSCKRPSFVELSQQLSLPDFKLLQWSEEDRSIHPEAAMLGASLQSAHHLYKDLQTVYQSST